MSSFVLLSTGNSNASDLDIYLDKLSSNYHSKYWLVLWLWLIYTGDFIVFKLEIYFTSETSWPQINKHYMILSKHW